MNRERVAQNARVQAAGAIVSEVNKNRLIELYETLSNIKIEDAIQRAEVARRLEDALRYVDNVRDFVGSPDHILGSQLTKHGEIAEQVDVNFQNARKVIEGYLPTATFDGVGRTAPEDYRDAGLLVQSKYINGTSKSLDHVLAHMDKYKDLHFGQEGTYYVIPKDQYAEIQNVLHGNPGNLSQKSVRAILEKVRQIEEITHRQFVDVVHSGTVTYAQVQQGAIHATLDLESEDLRENALYQDEKITQQSQEKKSQAELHAQPSVAEAAKTAAFAAGITGGFQLALGIYQKCEEGIHIQDFTLEDWQEIGIDTVRTASEGGISGLAIYGLTNVCNIPSPIGAAIVSMGFGLVDLTIARSRGDISQEEFKAGCGTVCINSVVCTIGACLGSSIIPIPILGPVLGSVIASNLLDEVCGKGAYGAILNASGYVYGMTVTLQQAIKQITANAKKTETNIRSAQKLSVDVQRGFDEFELLKGGINMATCELILDTSGASKNERILDDVRQAIPRLSTASEEQFREIKKEKWFHRLWDMVTLSSKKEIRMAEQITTLAQAQEGLIKILVILSAQNQEISDLVCGNMESIKKLQTNDKYLLNRLEDLENEVRGFTKDYNISKLPYVEKATLNSCIYYLSQQFEPPSVDQRDYARGILHLLNNEDTRTDGVDLTKEFLTKELPKIRDNDVKKCILRCCLEYIYLYRLNDNDFNGDICNELIALFDVGPQMEKDTKNLVVETVRRLGVEHLIEKYEAFSVDTTFRMELDLRSVVGELPESLELETASELTQPHEFPEIEECIKEHTTKDGAPLGESLPKEELLEILLPKNTPIPKTVVAITGAGRKSKKEKKKNDPLEYKEYLVFTTFALYHILDGKASKLPYEQMPENTGTELSTKTFYCGETKFLCKYISIRELESFCQEIAKIENKPRSDVDPNLTETETEAFFLGFSRISASIVKGKDGRPLHELYRILTSDFGEDAMELWPVIATNLDTPIETEISEWKHALIYPLEEISCASLVYCICRGILYSKGSNVMSSEDAHILHLISDSDDDIDAMQQAAQSERKKILQYIDGSDDSPISMRNKAIKELLASYDHAISAAKRFGETQIQEELENTLKRLQVKAKRIEHIAEMEKSGSACIEKWSKRAMKIGFIPGGCMPFVHGICSKMLKELNEIFKLPTSKRIDDNAFVDAIVGAIITPFMVMPIISAAAATGYVTQVGEDYLKALVTVIEKSTEDELENADLLEKRLQIALQERAESANESPKS